MESLSQPFTSNIGHLVSFGHLSRSYFLTHILQASLKALRLITVDETAPVPLEDRPEENLSPAEMRELLRRMRQVCM
jgi:hypothetical protein